MANIKSSKMVSLLGAVLYVFGTFCLANGEPNYNEMTVHIKHFTRNPNIGLPIVGLKNIFLPVPGLPHVRKIMFIPSSHIHKYGNQYDLNRNQHVHLNTFLEAYTKTDRRQPTLAPTFVKNTANPTVNIAANTISNNEITTERITKEASTSTADVQEVTDYSTTPVIETTTDVDYDEFNRMAVPPQVIASLLG